MILTVCIRLFIRMTMRHLISGTRKSVLLRSVSSVLARKITSGNMGQVLAVHVQKSTMTVVRSMAAVNRAVRSAVIVIVIWKYGTTYFHSLTMTDIIIIQILSRRILIQVWVLNVWLLLSRMWILFLMWIQFRHCATKSAIWQV